MQPMDNMSRLVTIESETNRGTFYSVDIESLTCTCPYFSKELTTLPIDDPHRLCKHLTQAVCQVGIPEFLAQYQSDIKWFAQQKARFKDRDLATHDKRASLSVGAVQTKTVNKKRKYCYIEAIADGKKISVAIPIAGGTVTYTVNNFHAQYDLMTQESEVPVAYRNMELAIISWIVNEYNKVRQESAPAAIAKDIDYKQIEKEFPEGSIRTISTEKKVGLVQFYEVVDNFEEEEYFHIKGNVDRERVEAIVRKGNSEILYSINGSKVYSFDIAPIKAESDIDISGFGKTAFTVSGDLSDKFPKTYWFIQKAVLKWLRDEFNRVGLTTLQNHCKA